jgi:type I site-specific restriction-modification system R (restriction) subunit
MGDAELMSDEEEESNPYEENYDASKKSNNPFDEARRDSVLSKQDWYSQSKDLHAKAEQLANSDDIDKTSALNIMKLMHSMDQLLMQAVHEKQAEIDRLKREMNNVQVKESMSARFVDTLSDTSRRLRAIEDKVWKRK